MFENKQDQQLFESVFKDDSHTDIKGYFDHDDSVYKAALIIAKHNHFELNTEDRSYLQEESQFNKLESIAESANAFISKIELQKNWHINSADSMILFDNKDNSCYIFIPTYNGKGKILNPITGKSALNILPSTFLYGYKLSKGFKLKPKQESVSVKGLFLEALKHNGFSLVVIFLVSIAIALLGWFTPVFTSKIMSESIPENRVVDFIQLPAILLSLLIIIFILGAVKNIILTKLIVKSTSNIQTAIFHRALHLPASYFGSRSAGSSTITLLSLQSIAQQLARGQANAIFSIVIAFFSVFMMLYYLPKVSLIIIGVLAIYFIFLITFSILRVKIYYDSFKLFQSCTSYLFQLCKGITKIKATAAENIILTKWFKRYAVMERVMFKVHNMNILEATFKSGINITLMVIVFLSIYFINYKHMTLGDYIGFTSAYGQFFVGVTAMADMVNDLAQNASTIKIVKPFLETKPELNLHVDLKKIKLRGQLQTQHLRFTYPGTNQPVLQDISFNIDPGQFVAFVGQSGSGKSTLLKLLLGFAKPTSGLLLYDGYPITQLNLRALRRQFGVVLQSAKLINGSIKENILGVQGESEDEETLWRSATAACIAEEIHQMPMGMHTVISGSEDIISRGQAQRILIARAIASNPKILFFDEATSALDTITQNKIMKNIEEMGITRVVIAHRLSTIKNADKIFAIHNGKIVETGDFASLVDSKGYFYSLVQHELGAKLNEEYNSM